MFNILDYMDKKTSKTQRYIDIKNGTLFVISAPSGAGKTSLTRALVDTLNQDRHTVEFSISYTTRKPRANERDGEDYHFVDHAEFERLIAADALLEHAEVFGNYYGTAQGAIERQLATGTDVILEIDWQGAAQVRQKMPECHSIFILPPSRAELENRLRHRGQDSEDVIAKRMDQAVNEMSHYAEADVVIINDDFAIALGELEAVFTAHRVRLAAQQQRHAELLKNLLARP